MRMAASAVSYIENRLTKKQLHCGADMSLQAYTNICRGNRSPHESTQSEHPEGKQKAFTTTGPPIEVQPQPNDKGAMAPQITSETPTKSEATKFVTPVITIA